MAEKVVKTLVVEVDKYAPGKNYRMSKPLKRMLALGFFKTKEERNSWKKMCISAEVYADSVDRAVYDKPIGKNGYTTEITD